MKSSSIVAAITADANSASSARRQAEGTLAKLESTFSDSTQKALTAAALVGDYPEWSITVTTSCFPAPWRASKLYASIDFYLTIPQVQTWADLVPLFDVLDMMNVPADKWTSYDDAQSYSRTYSTEILKDDAGGRGVRINVVASLPGDTETCKRVIVGYTQPKPQEAEVAKPIYELRCGDEVIPNSDSDVTI